MNTKQHWDSIYQAKAASEVSWFQPEARLSLLLIQEAVPDRTAAICDIGGGASTLVDGLLAAGYTAISVLDLSGSALLAARHRLGGSATRVRWVEADILNIDFPPDSLDVWHDRAVFHFLTDASDRQRYVNQVRRAVRPGGHVLVASFADNGPTRCSGLEVVRYSPESMHGEFGLDFRLLSSTRETHITPGGARQEFVYCLCRH